MKRSETRFNRSETILLCIFVIVSVSLTALRSVGFWAPNFKNSTEKFLYYCYSCFSFMFLLGTFLIIQFVDFFVIWGDLVLMTGTAFLMFTNLAQVTKIVNLLVRRDRIQSIISEADEVLRTEDSEEGKEIVRRCDRQTFQLQLMYLAVTLVTTVGWAASAEAGQLPFRGLYPYDTSKSPAFELTYLHQVGAIIVAACLNVGKDTLVSAVVAQCRCRLQLLGLRLRTLCEGMRANKQLMFSPAQELTVRARLVRCAHAHQAALEAAQHIQGCFSEPTFFQFLVSLVIICVTAFQLISVTGNLVRLLSMCTYLLNMMFQVFIYCYQGHHLSEESADIADHAYFSPWYSCSVPLRKELLLLMVRSRRRARITAGKFTTLSLASFMAIIKTSYSLFTLLQQVTD